MTPLLDSLVPSACLRSRQAASFRNALASLLLGGTAFLGITQPASAQAVSGLVITEVAPWGSGSSPYAADWFEVTNTTTAAINVAGWKFDDSSASSALGAPLVGISAIQPGESVIFIESSQPSTTIANFVASWFGTATGPRIGTYTGSGIGLSTSGDAVNLYDAAGATITGVAFGASPTVAPFATFINPTSASGTTLSSLSVVSTDGAFSSLDSHGVGSPGIFVPNTSTTTTTTPPTTVASNVNLVWPGAPTVTVVDVAGTYTSNLSGLDYVPSGTSAPGVIYAVRNGSPSAVYRLARNAAGQWVSDTSNNWSNGKTLVYGNGTGSPDAEGITISGLSAADGLFVGTERDNSVSNVSRNAILRYDVTSAASNSLATLTPTGDWNITADIAPNGSNLGIEAITWVPDSYLVSQGFRVSPTNSLYNPADYPNHGSGVFLVGIEGTGAIHAYVLNLADGSTFTRLASFGSTLSDSRGFNSVMELQFDVENQELWAVCDNGCSGNSAVFRIDPATGQFRKYASFNRPAGMPNTNNEGFTFADRATCVDGTRSAFWADDNNLADINTSGNALREGTLPCAAVSVPEVEVPATAGGLRSLSIVMMIGCMTAALLRAKRHFTPKPLQTFSPL